MNPFPMFVGSGRSGTTIFGLIFNAHPELAVAHEAHFVAALALRHPSLLDHSTFDTGLFLRALRANSNFRELGIPLDEVDDQLEVVEPKSYADAVRAVLELFAATQGKPFYGDKTPGYVSHLDLLGGLFPDAKFVHIIRDGRDVALSYLDRPEWGPRTIAECAFYWRTRVLRGRASGTHLGPARYHEVRYEALVEDPEATVSEVCKFLGLDYSSRMLRYHEKVTSLPTSAKDPKAFISSGLPITRGLRDWRQQMSRADVALFEAIAGNLLADLGYELSGEAPKVGTRLAVASALARWQLRRTGARLALIRRSHRQPGI